MEVAFHHQDSFFWAQSIRGWSICLLWTSLSWATFFCTATKALQWWPFDHNLGNHDDVLVSLILFFLLSPQDDVLLSQGPSPSIDL